MGLITKMFPPTREMFRKYIVHATECGTSMASETAAHYRARRAYAGQKGDGLVEAVWAMNRCRGVATRALDHASALRGSAKPILKRLRDHARPLEFEVLPPAPGLCAVSSMVVPYRRRLLLPGDAPVDVATGVAEVLHHYHWLCHYRLYIRAAVAAGSSLDDEIEYQTFLWALRTVYLTAQQ